MGTLAQNGLKVFGFVLFRFFFRVGIISMHLRYVGLLS